MPAEHPVAADLVPTEEGKSDGYGRAFDPNRLMDDDVFEDADYLSVDDIQAFLEETPYGTRSFLAEYVAQGESVSEMLHSAATEYGINPLVLITKLQVETSLVFQTVSPGTFTLDRAMGCGCPDGDPACSRAPKGLGRQIRCGARLFRGYLDELDARNRTISGWGKGIPKKSLEGTTVIPSNLSTAALYTYTPWVLIGQGEIGCTGMF